MSMSYAAKHLSGVLDMTNYESASVENPNNSVSNDSAAQSTMQNTSENGALQAKLSEDDLHNVYDVERDERAYPIDKSTGPVEMRIPVPWGHIAAKAWGSSKGHPLLGVHGWMDNAATFDTLAPYLPKSVYLVAVDLPGHGFSSHLPPGTPYHYTDFITSLRRIVNYFKWKNFSWIGHSMGAGLGSLYASLYPTQIDRLIMLDLVKLVSGDTTSGYASRIAMAIDQYLSLEDKITPTPPTYTWDEAIDRLMKATDGSLTEKSAKILLTRGSRRVSEDKWIFTRDLRLRSPTIMRFSHQQCFDVYKEIRCRLMIIKALDAPWFEKKEVCDQALKVYKASCASFKFAEVPGNHFVHLNEPEKIANLVRQFLLEQKAGL